MGVNLFQYKTLSLILATVDLLNKLTVFLTSLTSSRFRSQIPFIYSVCFAYPLHRYGRQQLCSWCNAPLTKHLTLLTQPAFECTATDSSCSSQLTLQVTFSSRIYHLLIYHLLFTISHLRPTSSSSSTLSSSFITIQRYRISTNYARKILTNHDESRHITPKKRQIAPYRAKTRQRLTSSSYLCHVLERGNRQVENPESTR